MFRVFLFLIITSFANISYAISNIEVGPGSYAVDNVEFFDVDGNKKFLDQYQGKTILLVFWATWCSNCSVEMPTLDVLQKDFNKLPFQILAVSQDFQGVEAIKNFFAANSIRHLDIYIDRQNQLFKAFNVTSIPTSFLINPEGIITQVFIGKIDWFANEIRAAILATIPGEYIQPRNSKNTQEFHQVIKQKLQQPTLETQTQAPKPEEESQELEKEPELKPTKEERQNKNVQQDKKQKINE